MEIAVVILNWNGAKLLEQFLPSVISYSEIANLYVIDNASTDTSIALLKNTFPTVTIIQNKENFGFAKGYNEGLKSINEPYLALINSDIEVTENWLEPIIETFKKEAKTAIIQPKILDYNKKTYFEYAGAAGGFIDKYGYPYCRGRIFNTIEADLGQFNDEREIFWASGACLFIRNSVFKELNGFDERFFAHQEEIDLCWRSFNSNYFTRYNPKSVVYHVGGATLDKSNPKKTFLNFRNSLLMLVKNVPKNKLFQVLFIRMILDGIAAFQFLFQLKPKHFIAVLRAHYSFYNNFSFYYKQKTTGRKQNYFNTKSIVYSYFVKKNKKFEQLS